MTADNIIGIDPHRRTFTATVLDPRGGEIGLAHFPNTRDGHGAGLAWAPCRAGDEVLDARAQDE